MLYFIVGFFSSFSVLWYAIFYILHPKFWWTHISENFRFEMFDVHSLWFLFFSMYTALFSVSGLTFIWESSLFEVSKIIFVLSVILWVFIDFFILSFISSKNQKFLQKHGDKNPQNKNFIIFFIFWRIFLPDIFVASSLAARYFRINLSKKHIFLVSLLVQVIRISLLAMVYFVFI